MPAKHAAPRYDSRNTRRPENTIGKPLAGERKAEARELQFESWADSSVALKSSPPSRELPTVPRNGEKTMRTLATFTTAALIITGFAATGATSADTETGGNKAAAADGVTFTTFSDGTEVRLAPAGTAEAANKKCGVNSVCLWKRKNYRGAKYTNTKRNSKECVKQLYPGDYNIAFPVKSLKTGENRGLTMYGKIKCRGAASSSFRSGTSVSAYRFNARSLR